jgi:hypothetical protein
MCRHLVQTAFACVLPGGRRHVGELAAHGVVRLARRDVYPLDRLRADHPVHQHLARLALLLHPRVACAIRYITGDYSVYIVEITNALKGSSYQIQTHIRAFYLEGVSAQCLHTVYNSEYSEYVVWKGSKHNHRVAVSNPFHTRSCASCTILWWVQSRVFVGERRNRGEGRWPDPYRVLFDLGHVRGVQLQDVEVPRLVRQLRVGERRELLGVEERLH